METLCSALDVSSQQAGATVVISGCLLLCLLRKMLLESKDVFFSSPAHTPQLTIRVSTALYIWVIMNDAMSSVKSVHADSGYLLHTPHQNFLHLLINLSCFAWHRFITGDSITIIINRCLLRRFCWWMWKTVKCANLPSAGDWVTLWKASSSKLHIWSSAFSFHLPR